MLRIILIYGFLAGAIAIAVMTVNVSQGVHSLLIGYLVLFAALTLIFVSTKRYRDQALGGVIRFWTAALFGLGVAAVASLVYCLGWELFLWSTDYRFFEEYVAADLEAKRAAGTSAAELAQLRAEVAPMIEQYNRQPLFRFVLTLFEILPVGIIVAFISATLLRRSNFLPARARREDP